MEELNKFNRIYDDLFNSDDFLDYDVTYSKLSPFLSKKLKFRVSYFFLYFKYKYYEDLYNLANNKFDNLKNTIDEHNGVVLAKEIQNFKNICGRVEGNELDDNQIDSIVRKNRNQLVIAGAGSGKTTTIVGKVKYLLKTYRYTQDEILLLSFTNAAATEMKQRIKNETCVELDVFTFHKLGLEIIKKSVGENINIFNNDLYPTIKELVNKNIENEDYLKKMIYFSGTARFNVRDEFDFTSEKEYEDYLKMNKPKTLKGEEVKSYGELEIANFLFKNGIEYIYENEYEFETDDTYYRQYRPDFYLPEYGIYIEYFGIDENNKVPSFYKGNDVISADDIYNQSIAWKRDIHQLNNTIMIETYYYENKKGLLIEKLERELKKYNVVFNVKSNEELWQIVNENNKGVFSEVCRVFSTIINLIKSNDYSLDYLNNLPEVINNNLNRITLELITPIYQAYQKRLEATSLIDFNDMINMAIGCIEHNKFVHKYKYVIVDEYQDISNSRFRLLNAMRTQSEYGLFCVGDDWQSIYRFNGSDINFITNFGKYWGMTYVSFIDKTYRFSSMMSILSGNFIMKNPKQYRKNLKAKISKDFAVSFINVRNQINCLDFLAQRLNVMEENSTVYFLGRYSFDVDMFKNNNKFMLRYNNVENLIEIIYWRRKDLKIRFMTVHKSKGLQADYVVIINNKNNGMGFPSKVSDLPFIKVLLAGKSDDYPYAEERRLFYVALTRAKNQTLLLTIDNNKSIFVQELERDFKKLLKNDTELKQNVYTCPKCGGNLVVKYGAYGKFLGCSNYPDCSFTRKY